MIWSGRRCCRPGECDLWRWGLHFCGRTRQDRAELVLAEVGVRLLCGPSLQVTVRAGLVDAGVRRLLRRRGNVLTQQGGGAL